MTPHETRTLSAILQSAEVARQRIRDGELDSADAHLSEVVGWLRVLLRDAEPPPPPPRQPLGRRESHPFGGAIIGFGARFGAEK